MDDNKRPSSHGKEVVGKVNDVHKRGEALNNVGQVGNGNRRPGNGGSNNNNSGQRGPGGFNIKAIITILILLLGGGGAGLGGLLGGGGSSDAGFQQSGNVETVNTNSNALDTKVANGARDKRTVIKGNGQDVITIMVYMCGTDLESKYGMATADMTEMMNATISDNVNVIVYTGGCKSWQNNNVSSKTNQIYQIKSGKMICLESDLGEQPMTKVDTLVSFIQYCNKNFPANRNDIIFWDHGGGSISGYGYDEKFASSGSMNLAGINTALKTAGVTFDFIGFDACLMATVENGIMLTQYGDYMIASEETEPGVGWYYTNWLTNLSKNTSMPTIEIGKNIIDDFVDVCAQKCKGQQTTLSIVDLAELQATVPAELTSFSKDTNNLIQKQEYQTVSTARYSSREFAQSSKIDQVDLVDFAKNLKTDAGDKLAKALQGCVKYNRTSKNMTNAYGLSIYFPYKKASKVDQMVNTYQSIGMDTEYSKCIQEFASLEVCGQAATESNATDALPSILGSLVSNALGSQGGIDLSSFGFLSGKSMSDADTDAYIASNTFDVSQLVWTKDDNGYKMDISNDQWNLINDVALNVFYDDGEGYIDLGQDNIFTVDDNDALRGDYDNTWFSIDGQLVAFYYVCTVDEEDGEAIYSYVPALLNGERVNLIVVFDNEHPTGYLAGAQTDYQNGETETVAKNLTEVKAGDTLDFLCEYINYDGSFEGAHYFGEQTVVTDDMVIGYSELPDDAVVSVTYTLTDIYNQNYWTPEIPE